VIPDMLALLLPIALVASGFSTDVALAPTTRTARTDLDQAYDVCARSVLGTLVASSSAGVNAGFASSPTMGA
jgi:hypothetical protein